MRTGANIAWVQEGRQPLLLAVRQDEILYLEFSALQTYVASYCHQEGPPQRRRIHRYLDTTKHARRAGVMQRYGSGNIVAGVGRVI